MIRVVLITRTASEPWLIGTVLKRKEVELLHADTYEKGFQLLLKQRCDLFIAGDGLGGEGLAGFLDRFRSSVKVEGLRGLVLSNAVKPVAAEPPVVELLSDPPDPEAFDRCLTEVLRISTRASTRYLVHLRASVRGELGNRLGSVVAVKINAGGMLVESVKPLQKNKLFVWSFSGVSRLKNVLIPGTVIDEDSSSTQGGLHYYMVKFDDRAQKQRQALARYLEENY